MSKFKVGDKVIGNKKATCHYAVTKEGWRGVVMKVCGNGMIFVTGDGARSKNGFGVNEKYFDHDTTEGNKIVITSDGKTTTAALYDGKRRIKSTEARCSDSDVFDFMTGAEIAMDRLTGHPHKEATPSDLRELLAEGVFGKSKYGLFVVINKRLVFQSGGFNFVAEYSPNLTSRYDLIEWIVEGACSFSNAEDKFTENKGIVWKR